MRLSLMCLFFFYATGFFAQERPCVLKGTVTTIVDQRMRFANLCFSNGKINFTNLGSNSPFTYSLTVIKKIEDESGAVIYQKEEIPPPAPENPKVVYPESGERRTLHADLVLISGDTLHTNIKVPTNMFDSQMINELYVTEKVTTFENGVKKVYIPAEIEILTFTDPKGRKRTFLNNGAQDLIERLYNGKIKWFRTFYQGASYGVQSTDLMVNEANETIQTGMFKNLKNNMKKITARRPELIPMIDNMEKTDQGILHILREYDKM